MHNFRGYDHHLIVKALNKVGRKIHVIPTNSERYLSVFVDNLKFIDSLQFMNASLSDLVENLESKGWDGFSILEQVFGSKASLLTRKGVFPYDYIDSWKRFDEPCLPPKKLFYNKLTKTPLSSPDYKYGKLIFKAFKKKNLGKYHDLYLLCDTILLACVFEQFRKMSLENFNLDPVHYLTAPGLVWDAALKMSGVKLDLLMDVDKYVFFEHGIRGRN